MSTPELVGLGFTTSDAATGQRIQCNVVIHGGDDLNFTAASTGSGGDIGFVFANVGRGPGRIELSRPGYVTRVIECEFPTVPNLDYALEPEVATVRPWQRDGLNYIDVFGQVQKVHSVSGFSFLRRFVLGETDLLLRLAEKCHAYDINTLRYFTMFRAVPSVGRPEFSVRDYRPEQMAEANEFMRSRMGLRPWAVGFCDQFAGSGVDLTPAQQDAHWLACQDANPDELEGVNEPGRNGGANGGYELSSRLSDPREGIIAFRGCVDDGEDPRAAGSLWDGTTTHAPRGSEQGRKPGKVCYEDEVQGGQGWRGTGMPCRAGEPFQISQATARECADAAAACELMGAGFDVHDQWADSLQNCLWPTGQDDKLTAIRSVWRAGIYTDLVGGVYDRDHILTGDHMGGAARYYVMHDGQRGAGVICYADTSSVRANDGWRIVSQGGFEGNVVILEKA